MPFLALDNDLQYADAQAFTDHVNSTLAQNAPPPPPAEGLTTGAPDQGTGTEQTPPPAPPVSAPPVTPPAAPAPTPAPDPSQVLDKNGVVAYVQQHAADFGLDPAAVLAVAHQEGLNTDPGSHWTVPGESNISFGPPSWFGNGAGADILKQQGANAAAWSWTPPGIDYWLSQVSQVAKGLSGTQAIAAIVNGFERPRADLAPGEVQNAQQQYATYQQPVTGATTAAAPAAAPPTAAAAPAAPAATSPLDDFTQHVKDLTQGVVDLGQQATGAVGQAASNLGSSIQSGVSSLQGPVADFNDHVKQLTGGLVDLSSAPATPEVDTQAAGVAAPASEAPLTGPVSAAAPPPPPPPQQPGLLDQVKQKFSDALDSLGAMLSPNAPPLAPGLPSNPMALPLNASLGTSTTAAPLPPGQAPEPSGAALLRQATGPSILDQMQTAAELTAKYPSARGPLPDLNAMTPEDRQAFLHAMVAVGGIAAPQGSQFDKYGVEVGQVPPAAKPGAAAYPSYPAPVTPTGPPAASSDVLTGLINEAKARGLDTSALEAQLPKAPEPAPPAQTFDANGNPVTGGGVTVPGPTEAATRVQAGGTAAVPPTTLPQMAGVSTDTMQAAYGRIEQALGPGTQDSTDAISNLDQLVQHRADPGEVARFMAGVTGQNVGLADVVRAARTGSMAGGLATELKVGISPIIQTAMRAPAAAVHAIVSGNAGDIPAGLTGGLGGLAEGAADGMQTLRYGVNYRAALTGGADTGYGFKPGLDVLGSGPLQRAAGTALTGLVRTHGAFGDIAAGIGRGANLATGATPEAAAEAGQQWAMRSGNYGTVGQFVADKLGDLRQVNPAVDIASQVILPFYRVGYNVLTQGIERSPLGGVGTGWDVIRAAAGKGPYAEGGNASGAVTPLGQRVTNNLFGVGLASLGLAQATAGNLTGEHPENGAPPWSVRTPLGWTPIRNLGPAGESLAQSAALYEGIRDGHGDIPQMAQRTAEDYAGHIFDESWLRSISDAIGTVADIAHLSSSYAPTATTAAKDLAYQAGNIGKSFVPQATLLGQVKNAVAPAATNAPSSRFSAPTVRSRAARTARR